MKKRTAANQKTKGKYVQHGEPLMKDFPEICKYMWDCYYDDGTPRELSRLSVSLTPSGVQISLTDPSERCTAFTDGGTFHEALEALEASLATGKDPWRPWPKNFGKK